MKKENRFKRKQKPWIRRRHRVILRLFGPLLGWYTQRKYGVDAERFAEQGTGQYLVLYNHQTPFDQFFIMNSFDGPVYHLATEDIFSKGWISSLIRWTVAPIPIKKQTTDLNAIRSMIRVAREGGTLAMAPEGNRTYSGRTGNINPAVAHLAKKLCLPIALYRIEGGYGVQPRWSDSVRKGKMHAYVSRVIHPGEIEKLSEEELYTEIREGLYVDDAAYEGKYVSNHKAEYLERMVYVCPYCGFSVFQSAGDEIACKTCGRTIRYGEDKCLEGVGFDFPFKTAGDWYECQEAFVNCQDLQDCIEKPLFQDTVDIYEVIAYMKKNRIGKKREIFLYGNRIEIHRENGIRQEYLFEEISGAAVLGRNKLNLYYGKTILQFKGDKHFNALKYMNLYYRYRHLIQGDIHGEFLGI